jgi:peroxiredoxin
MTIRTIRVGSPIPDVLVRLAGRDANAPVSAREVLGGPRTVLFGVPGAFTSVCSDVHLPGFLEAADALRAKGVETIACVALNDHEVMAAWARARGVREQIVMLADGNGDFTRALGLELDLSRSGYGVRSRRYAAILEHGVVRHLAVEPDTAVTVSAAEKVLAAL